MKSQKLLQLSRCNKFLRNESWYNYQKFLNILLRSIEHPIAGDLLQLLLKKDFTNLVKLADSIASTEFSTPGEHLLLNQLSAVIRKYPFPHGSVNFDPRGTAVATFLKSERKCSRINRRFQCYQKLRSPHEELLSVARSWISYVLGPLDLESIWDLCDFGPGASVGVHGNATNSGRKLLSENWSVSPSAFHYAYAACSRDTHITELLLKRSNSPFYCLDKFELFESIKRRACFVDYNKITFVPKTAKTERTIAVEPLLNGFVQKGVDQFMRKRLKRVGIDLSDQGKNQELARLGSLEGSLDPYVSIDLSSASDSVSIELCRYMLPPEWFDFLNSLRSKQYQLNGSTYTYNKFASMGNGFCFPLETLIFASLCEAAYKVSSTSPDYSVYGDDILVRQSVASHLFFLLKICGFTVNTDKTFIKGPFRESCGADWFKGKDVRPMTLDYAFDSIENIFKFCNLSRSKDTWKCIFQECTEFLVTLIPKSLMFVRPYPGQPDSALEVDLDIFMASPFSRYSRSTFSWSWVELMKSAAADIRLQRVDGYSSVVMRGVLTGGKPPHPFAFRRKTRTKVRRITPSPGFSTETVNFCGPPRKYQVV